MLDVAAAAAQVRRNPETIRRWIRTGRLRATKIGLQHFIDPEDLEAAAGSTASTPLPDWMRLRPDGRPQPPWVQIVRDGRRGH